MAKFQNVSPLGALDLPLVGRVVESGEEFEVPDELAVHLEGQDESFRRVETVSRSAKSTADKTTAAAAGNPESEGTNEHAA